MCVCPPWAIIIISGMISSALSFYGDMYPNDLLNEFPNYRADVPVVSVVSNLCLSIDACNIIGVSKCCKSC